MTYSLSDAKTSDLINELIKRGIIPHEYQLIFNNKIRADLKEYNERQLQRSAKRRATQGELDD